ncbi:MAG TPA: hypothetical protein VM529_27090 [Gemmata sp.]|nr:hypothetical protein [Gemmata sp.]
MGMETVLLGYIAEPWVARDVARSRLFRQSNRRVLAGLPDSDEWPPLIRGLFAWTEADSLRGGYRGSVIHFGGRFKSIEQEWDQWLTKYEAVLRRLYWESSVVHLDTEASGSFRFDWWLSSWDGLLASPPQLPSAWEFRGPFRRWADATQSGA